MIGKNVPEITIRKWVTENPPDIDNPRGRVFVFEFWATWCGPCVEDIPYLIRLNSRYKEKGLVFIALSQDKCPKKLRRFVRSKGINYHVAVDNGTVDRFGVTGYPTVVVADHRGKVVWEGSPRSLEFERAIVRANRKSD